MTEFESVRLWLRNTYNIGVSDEWLTACLEWIQQEYQGVLPPVNDLLPQVFQQWLLSDLSEIGEQVLPQNIVNEEKSELVGNYPLQLLSLVDVGFPLYGQKQKLQGRVNTNEEVSADKPFQPGWEPKPSRMLLFRLTDGHTHIQALEYKQIKDLHAELPSGLKLLVSGKFLCRRGVLMLTPDCVQVLGGEVDTLVEQNTPLAVLEREMMRNREDEGKHAKTQFSGAFLSCGADKMLDNSQKQLKTEGYSGLTSCARMSRPGSQQVKLEPRGFASSSLGHFSLKQETGSIDSKVKYVEQEFKHVETWQKQEDDMNYDDCFGDDLDLQEIDAFDRASPAGMQEDTSETIHSGIGFHRSDSCRVSDLKLSTSLDQSTNLSNADDVFEAFDDDFEIDDISDVFESNDSSVFGSALPGGVARNASNSTATSTFMQNAAAGSNGKNSQSTLHQSTQPVNTLIQQKPYLSSYSVPVKGLQNDTLIQQKPYLSSYSVPVKGLQNDLARKNIVRVRSSPQKRIDNVESSTRIPAKKQVKLLEMFASSCDKNKPKLMSSNDDFTKAGSGPVTESHQMFDDDCCIIDNGRTAQESWQKTNMTLSSNSSSKYVTTSSSGMTSFSNSSSKCLLDCDDRTPFQYLSSWTDVQPPASLTIKAYISTLTDKLGTNGGANWSLSCRINDGTACMDVDLADNVLAELIGFSAKDSVIMRQKMKTEPRVKDVLMEGLSKCQQKLINMSCLMEVDFVSAVRKPVVRKLIPVSSQHVLQLLKRVEKLLSV
ncbi:unnamed protein product [Candidula unifasciata]|uniref:RecQ-mediated genome instability protein 1 n=1 Tax=Candidula unifasciata TaxID=100452 RepID=A0A8S3ZXH8_9EUPU|nr:unnamed protein product [Candidula unifasciata]